MSHEHEHNFWWTAGGLVCACGASKGPALELTTAQQATVDRFGIFDSVVAS